MSRHPAPPALPYRWHPLGTRTERRPAVGALVAWRHRVWRVVGSEPRPEVDWSAEDREFLGTTDLGGLTAYGREKHRPWMTVLRPVAVTGDDPRARDYDVHLSVPARNFGGFDVYPDEHYPVCAQCAEPLPCREVMARDNAEAAAKKTARYEMAGVCPACNEPVTTRHKAITFDENLEIPGGAPVTYHLRRDCRGGAIGYEQRWAAADPDHRATRLSCSGRLQRHLDGTECSEGPLCPSPDVPHPAMIRCWSGSMCTRCADAIARRNAAGDWTVWSSS